MRLNEEQQRLILTLARPLPRAMRDQFFQRVSAEIAVLPVLGDGMLYRLAAGVQRQMLDPPILDGADELL
jgi:hypothetical protein